MSSRQAQPGSSPLLQRTLIHLTQEEFKLCFVLAWMQNAEGYGELFNLRKYATPVDPVNYNEVVQVIDPDTGEACFEEFTYWFEELWRAIRFLALERGYRFEGLRVYDGSLVVEPRNIKRPVEPRNALYVGGIATNSIDYELAVATVVHMIQEGRVDLPLDSFRAMLADIRESVEWAVKATSPEQSRHYDELRDKALEEIGVTRLTKLTKSNIS